MSSEQHDDAAARLRRAIDQGAAPVLSSDIVTQAPGRRAPRLVNHGRVARTAGGSVLAIAAVTAASLVITQPFAPRAPLFTAAGGAAEQSAFGAAAESSDLRIGVWKQYEYVAGDGLATSGGSGAAYALERTGAPEATLDGLADVFDLVGEAVRASYFDESYPSYIVGPEDGSAPALTITWAGTASWWYSDPAASGWTSCAVPGDVGADGTAGEAPADEPLPEIAPEICEPVPPTGGAMPSEDEARDEAAAILTATGLDVDAEDIRVTADDWQTVASANLVVDGVETALDWAVAWGPGGEIAWAYGHAVDIVGRGTFGTVSERDAVSRLSDGRWFGAAGPEFQGGGVGIAEMAGDAAFEQGMPGTDGDGATGSSGAAVDPGTEPAPAPTDSAPPAEPVPSEPAPEPAPVDPVEPAPTEPEPVAPTPIDPSEPPVVEPEPLPEPTPEVEIVTVNEAEATLLLMWDSEGDAWLVPGYAYRQAEGWWSSVVSLVEGVIALPEPIEYRIEPMPLPAEE
ncbi:hypothetical protein [Yonghaparkia sp. Root332]|uniref:hypothetical protein n=1 Tax=Yonghaparkia sp. Root332 TaxID=1736516 RepID=UPI0006F56598|nr:hypothetical protein [Yonghaparkia sp. Root332]KQV24693.1 hypothetical protein ASC54_09265 [Yonghaparkia sp. Root332]